MSKKISSILAFPGCCIFFFFFVGLITLGISLAGENFKLNKKWMDHGSPFLQSQSSYPIRQLNHIRDQEHLGKSVNLTYLRKRKMLILGLISSLGKAKLSRW